MSNPGNRESVRTEDSHCTTVEVCTTLEGLSKYELMWRASTTHPNADYDLFLSVCQERNEVVSPFVMLGTTAAGSTLVLARLEEGEVGATVGYAKWPRIQGRVIHVLHAGVLGADDASILAAVVWRVAGALASGVASAAVWHHVSDDSILGRVLSSCPAGRVLAPRSSQKHWTMTLPAAGLLFAGLRSKRRAWLRKKAAELDEVSPDGVVWAWLSGGGLDVGAIATAVESVASKSYQRGLNAGFRDLPENRRRLQALADNERLRVLVLWIDGEPRAYWMGARYSETFHSWATAYDPDLRSYEPGNLMFFRMIDELSREGVTTFDFGLGDAFYKSRFGDRHWGERTVYMFAPTFRGKVMRAALLMGEMTAEWMGAALSGLGRKNQVKAWWRRHREGGGE